jgi:hypothetical protein
MIYPSQKKKNIMNTELGFFGQMLLDCEKKANEALVAEQTATANIFSTCEEINDMVNMVAKMNSNIAYLEELQVAVERYGVDAVAAIVSVETLANAGISIDNDSAYLETFSKQVHIIYLQIKNFLAGLIDRLVIFIREALLWFNGISNKVEAFQKSFTEKKSEFIIDSPDKIMVYSVTEFETKLKALETLDKKDDETALKILTTPITMTEKTLKELEWTQDKFVVYAFDLLPLLKGRNGEWSGLNEVRQRQVALEKLNSDSSIIVADKIKTLEEHTTEIVEKIRSINHRIKETAVLGKQLIDLSKAAEPTSEIGKILKNSKIIAIM